MRSIRGLALTPRLARPGYKVPKIVSIIEGLLHATYIGAQRRVKLRTSCFQLSGGVSIKYVGTTRGIILCGIKIGYNITNGPYYYSNQ